MTDPVFYGALSAALIVLVFATGPDVSEAASSGSLGRAPSPVALPDPCSTVPRSRVAGVLGVPVATLAFSRVNGGRVCTWTSRPLGYMQSRQALTVTVSRATKPMFKCIGRYSIPAMTPFRAGSAPAFWSDGTVVAWKAGVLIELDGGDVNVYPNRVVALINTMLAQIRPQEKRLGGSGQEGSARCGPNV